MALADIISRLAEDAEREAEAILADARQRADAARQEAARTVATHRAEAAASACDAAEKEASRLVVAARLAERDATLAERRALIGNALSQTALALSALPDDDYARFLGRKIAGSARDGDTVRLGTGDLARSDAIARAVDAASPGLSVTYSGDPAPFERGAYIEGHRVRADLSLSAIVEEQRDTLESIVASKLFPGEA